MKVKSVVIDGFKSYAHRQELADLDPHFNAITGLNGSGKSNVFDAICFVMGLRNVAKARVERPEELIYKNGKAGIQRAAVTIEFDNTDPSQAPAGFSSHEFPCITVSRQIDTGLRQRFFLNGRQRDADSIKEFFLHASLNIENPHFLVQQGQIHRLVGMKPQDILGFIEEAAGTSVFDHSRRRSELQMRSKEKRLGEINATIVKEIAPRLELIEKQEADHAKLVEVEAKIGQLLQFHAALELYNAELKARDAKNRLDTVVGRIADLQLQLRETLQTIQEKERGAHKLDADMQGPTNRVEELEKEVNQLRNSLTKTRTTLTLAQKQCAGLEKEVQKLENEHAKARERFENFSTNSDDVIGKHEELKTAIADAQKEIEDLGQSLRLQRGGITAGLGGVSLAQEKSVLEQKLVALNGELKRSQSKIDSLDQQINNARRDQQNMASQQTQREQQLERAREEVEAAEAAYRPFEQVRKRAETIQATLQQHHEKCQQIMHTLIRDYSLCAPLHHKHHHIEGYHGADISTEIHGKVGALFQVQDEAHSLALTVGAGAASLARVVVSSGAIAQLLIEKGGLQQRTSFMPINESGSMNHHQQQDLLRRVNQAKQIASQFNDGWAELAVNVINFDRETYTGVMERVFGNFVICPNMQVATAIADERNLRLKAVTLDGDVCDPQGTMTGGSKNVLTDHVALFARARPLIEAHRNAQAEVQQMREELSQINQNSAKTRVLGEAVDRARQQAEAIEHALKSTRYAEVERHLQQLVEQRDATVKAAQETLPRQKDSMESRLQEIARSENLDSATMIKQLEQQQAKARTKLENLKKELDRGNEQAEKQNQQKESLRGKLDALQSSLDERKAELAVAKAEEAKYAEEVHHVEQKSQQGQAMLFDAKTKLDALKQQYATVTKELDDARQEKAEIDDSLDKSHTERGEVERNSRSAAEELRKIEHSSTLNSFMTPAIRQSLGDPNGDYYFQDRERTSQTVAELHESELLVQALNKKVNRSALASLDQRKAENRRLVEQRDALVEDKSSIVTSIVEIEKRKWSALDDVVKRVSEHFSALFNTCLDYATCRLAEQRDHESGRLLGLEVKVAFNGKEKAGLTELSGGQRSLLALCLILSILKVHKAPVYILDEVDAALDPSHTQNLGLMLKKHFADAQFLLVSLKDGMFSSANVIYEVRNTTGFSEVTRKQMKRN